jgi:hypothetical protein
MDFRVCQTVMILWYGANNFVYPKLHYTGSLFLFNEKNIGFAYQLSMY